MTSGAGVQILSAASSVGRLPGSADFAAGDQARYQPHPRGHRDRHAPGRRPAHSRPGSGRPAGQSFPGDRRRTARDLGRQGRPHRGRDLPNAVEGDKFKEVGRGGPGSLKSPRRVPPGRARMGALGPASNLRAKGGRHGADVGGPRSGARREERATAAADRSAGGAAVVVGLGGCYGVPVGYPVAGPGYVACPGCGRRGSCRRRSASGIRVRVGLAARRSLVGRRAGDDQAPRSCARGGAGPLGRWL